MDKEIKGFIKGICDELGIPVPKIKINNRSDTQLACLVINDDKYTLLLRNDYDNIIDVYFSLAHELRHEYQAVNDYFRKDCYKRRNKLSLRDYNLQLEEIDANAFAYFIIVDEFKIKPLFNGLDKDIVEMIKKRAKWIVENEY